ncbi:MAG: helix-turn-helix transcriptional regulator [Woeseia sp.]|nr:helix-turn-helix transcriptional regulator [Woeseia sp.]MBT8095940.1 helix-turn-helix transcriptional regulator [Woeseia sp.]NNE61086.1 helix-turn-helix transcriptional regulator [Woeseia sp.]NNL53766.1 helix-turn-helix transcriptional regulator [Woeseia sp.]
MSNHFETAAWHGTLSRIIRADSASEVADALAESVGLVVDHEGTCLLAFHRDAGPEVLHHTLEPAGARHYLDRYLDGPYLLDPLYQLAMQDVKPNLCRFREKQPDRFRSSEYYRQYCERTHLLDEMDFLSDVTSRSTLVLVVGRRKRRFSQAELRRLEVMESTVRAAMQRVWALREDPGKSAAGDRAFHERLTHSFEHFGEDVLTRRERQISQLLLRGHSSKSIARELKIAPGTVMVHKRNLFAKLGISSQYELFSLLIDELGR